MGSAKYCFSIEQGTDLRVPFVLKDSEGMPLNLDGCAFRMQMRKSLYDLDAVDTLTTANGRIVCEPAAGRFELIFPNDVTEAYPVQALLYDIELVTAGSEVRRIVEGRIKVLPEVTRVRNER